MFMNTDTGNIKTYAGILAVCQLLNKHRLDTHNEKVLQAQIEKIFKGENIPYEREVRLSERSIIDFIIDKEIGIEVKIKGSAKDIFRQLERYLEFDDVKALVLVTSKAIRLPKSVKGKFTYVINLGMSWL